MSEQDFDFEEFIEQNELTVIKQCFIDHDMTNIDTLNMNNPQFTKLMGDKTILSNAHLIQNIVNGIQSLQKSRNPKSIPEKRLIFTSLKETNTFTNIEDYIDNLKTFETELQTTINTNIKNRQQQNDEEITKYTTKNTEKLSTIHTEINKTITKLHNIFTQQEQIWENKINKYRNNVKQIDLSHTQNSKMINNALSSCLSIIDTDIKYFQNAIKQCRDIVHKYEEETDKKTDNDKYTFKRSNTTHRENEIIKIGTTSADYYNKNITILNDNKNTIVKYNENELKLNMKQIYSLTINDNIYNNICNNINKLIKLNNNKPIDDIKQEPIQIIHVPPAKQHIQKVEQKQQIQINANKKSPQIIIKINANKDPPAAYSQYISPVPIPRIQPKETINNAPPIYDPQAKVLSKKDLQKINSQKKIQMDEKNKQNNGENYHHNIDESISIDLDNNFNNLNQPELIFQLENNNKSHSPPPAFEKKIYWECTVCTFAENPGSFLICKICGSSRQLSEKKKYLQRQHSLSDPPLMIPQSKSELQFRARSDSTEAKVNALKNSGNKNGNGNGNKKMERSQSVAAGKKKKNNRGLFGWNKNKKKSPKSKNKKKVKE